MRYAYTRIDANLPPRPYVNIILRVAFATTDTLYGLVDTGADYPILPLEFANTLNLKMTDGIPWNFRGTTGKLQIAYLHNVELTVWDSENANVAFRFFTDVSFCEDFKFPGGVILGQNGFLSHFQAIFNQAENYFDLDPRNPAIAVDRPNEPLSLFGS